MAEWNNTLQPGTYTETFNWNGHTQGAFNGTKQAPHEGPRVPPGLYDIRAVRNEVDLTFYANTTVQVV